MAFSGITTVEASFRSTDWEARQARINAAIDRVQAILNAPVPPHLSIPGQTPPYSHLRAAPFEDREDTRILLCRRASDLAKLELRANRIAAEGDGEDMISDFGLSAVRIEAKTLVKKCEDLKEELWGPSPYKIVQGRKSFSPLDLAQLTDLIQLFPKTATSTLPISPPKSTSKFSTSSTMILQPPPALASPAKGFIPCSSLATSVRP